MNKNDLKRLLQRPIAFQRVFVDVAGSACGGLFLSQLFYWSDKGADPQGWIYKTREEWEAETGLIRYEQERARAVLREKGILEEKREGLPLKLYYRLNYEKLGEAMFCPLEITIDEKGNPIRKRPPRRKATPPQNRKPASDPES